MLLTILLFNLVLCLTHAGASPKPGLNALESLVEKLESRLRDMEIRLEETEARLEAKDKEMEMRLESKDEEMEMRLEELEGKAKKEKDSLDKLRTEAKEVPSNNASNNALTKPSLRDLPIVIISAWQSDVLRSPQTVTFESFLANFNNGNRPGGGSGILDLDSGVFTCFTPGYYTVSFSASAYVGPNSGDHAKLFLYKNGSQIPESNCGFWTSTGAINADVAVTVSRNLILHMDEGDTLEMRMTDGKGISTITLDIALIGLGFDYLV